MKCIVFVSCILALAFVGQAVARKPLAPCNGNSLDGYKGVCDDNVPIIVVPKGRPIMERVLDWLKCCTGSCAPEPTEPPSSTPTSTTPSTPGTPSSPPISPPATSPPAPTGTATPTATSPTSTPTTTSPTAYPSA